MEQETCPNNNGEGHRFFINKTYEVFEPYKFVYGVDKDNLASLAVDDFVQALPPLYQRREYAVLGCNCGSVIRQEVKDA